MYKMEIQWLEMSWLQESDLTLIPWARVAVSQAPQTNQSQGKEEWVIDIQCLYISLLLNVQAREGGANGSIEDTSRDASVLTQGDNTIYILEWNEFNIMYLQVIPSLNAADTEVPQNVYTMMIFYEGAGNHQYNFDFAAMKRLDANIEVIINTILEYNNYRVTPIVHR